MNYLYGCNEDYLDEDDDGIMYSTRDYCSDSDDEALSINFFQQKTKRKTQTRSCSKKDVDIEDEFEKDMHSELSLTMQKLTAPLLSNTQALETGNDNVPVTEPEYYDDIYFDSEGSEPEENTVSPQASKSKYKKRVMTNDELLYDPNMDDEDQAWVDKKRQSYQLHNSRRLPKSEGALKPKPLPQSDAVLNCPACFTTLCLDCQRHSIYKDQYRAMFVFNCIVDKSEVLHFMKKGNKKKFKKPRPTNNTPVNQEAIASISNARVIDCGALSSIPNKVIDELVTNDFNTDDQMKSLTIENSPDNSKEKTDVTIPNSQIVEAGVEKDEDKFNPVKCSICNTKVAVYDKDEVYHFFNIITSY